MKKILLSSLLFICSMTLFAQWTTLNSGWPIYSGTRDVCKGIATSNTCIFAATNHGIIRVPRLTNGQPSGTWSIPPTQPFPTYPVGSITSSGNNVFYLIDGAAVYKTSGNATPGTFIISNPSGLYTFPNRGVLTAMGSFLYLLDMDNHILYKKILTDMSLPWTYVSIPTMELCPYDFTCMKAKNELIYIGTSNSILRISMPTLQVENVMTGKYCYALEPIRHSINVFPYNKSLLATISDGSGFPHPTAKFVRYDRIVVAPISYTEVYLGTAGTHNAQILSTTDATYTNRYYCTNLRNPGGTPSIHQIGKSVDAGATWISGDYVGLPSGIAGGGSTTYSQYSSFGNTVNGTAYLFSPYDGFYYHSPLSSMRMGNLASNNFETPLTIFPNPTDQSFKLQGEPEHFYTIHLVDMQGKTLFNSNGSIETINMQLSNLPNLTNGVYLVQLRDLISQESKTEKLIKR